MFAGVGGFRAGLTRVGGFQCVGHYEIDKYAEASYRAIHDIREEERYYPDARAIDPDDLPQFDLLCGGFPCQAFSNAGRRKGFADARGTLFFEIARLAEAKRPRYLLLENVPGLLSHDHGKTFAAILSALDDLGYHVEWTVLNSKHFGVPQSRKRVFLICYLDPRCAGKILPVPGGHGKALIQVLGGSRASNPPCLQCDTYVADFHFQPIAAIDMDLRYQVASNHLFHLYRTGAVNVYPKDVLPILLRHVLFAQQ